MDTMSEELQSLLQQIFTVKPEDRPTAQECKTHVWFQKLLFSEVEDVEDAVLSNEVLLGLQKFHGRNRLRRECLQILVKMINPKEFITLRKAFNKIDTNGSGTIEIDELKQAVRKWHVDMDEAELERIVKEVDILGTGVIKYHEFIAATFPVEKYATQERLRSLFQ